MVHFKDRSPTAEDIASLQQYCLTKSDIPWNPSAFCDQMADKFYQQFIDTENDYILLDSIAKCLPLQYNGQKLSFHNPLNSLMKKIKGNPVHLVHVNSDQKINIDGSILVNTGPHYSKALPSKIDYERLSPYFAFRPHDVIQQTLRQTTQVSKSTIHYPMQHHLKSRFQTLRHVRLNEVIATDTCSSCSKSTEGYHCAQVFFGMTSKMLYVTGIKTESEFPDVYQDFIW
jgi:hypothetical protein